MQIIEAARVLQDRGLGSMSPITLIRYFDIYAKYRIYLQTEKVTDAVFLTADATFCSEALVWKVMQYMKKQGL